MELWVRNQDKDHLIKIEEINIEIDEDGFIGIWSYGSNKYLKYYLGTYSTKERALEVLDEIQNKIVQNMALLSLMNNFTDLKGNEKGVSELFKDLIYEMPKE